MSAHELNFKRESYVWIHAKPMNGRVVLSANGWSESFSIDEARKIAAVIQASCDDLETLKK